MAMRCIAIDDEPLALRQIAGYISKIPTLELLSTFRSAVAAKEWLKENEVDLIFVDINMPDMTGVEFVQTLNSKAMVIFTTAYAEYAIEGFKLSAIDYLLKPFGLNEIARATEKAQSLYELIQLQDKMQREQGQEQNETTNESDEESGVLSVHADRKTHIVKLSNIVYLESAGEYVRLHLADGTKLVTLFRLKNMESSLQSAQFMRVHRSYIVNLDHVSGYTKGRVFLANDDYVPIGDSYKEQFISRVESAKSN